MAALFARTPPQVLQVVCLLACTFFIHVPHARGQVAQHIVISEIYGGGGNSGSLYTHDFIELYNPTASSVQMTDWSVQYQSGSGSGPFGAVAVFSGIVPSHGYFLIQANQGSGGTQPLPAADAVAGFSMAATSGKIALVADTLPVSGPTDTMVVDFIGYGSANLFEGGGAASGAGNTASLERKAAPGSDGTTMGPGGSEEFHGNGRDSDENADDFVPRSEPEPQNSAADPEHPGGGTLLGIGYLEKWNLVSIPLDVPDPGVSVLFPGALTPFYAYAGEYLPDTIALVGRGYWVKLAGDDTITFTGNEVDSQTIVLDTGWNLVGAVSSPMAVSGIIENPPGHLKSGFFSYDGGYSEAAVLTPGRGYWVRSAGGSITLSPVSAATHFMRQPGLETDAPRVMRGNGFQGEDLPPAPPGGAPEISRPGPGQGIRRQEVIRIIRAGPNPFNPRTVIEFDLRESGVVEVTVVDLAGRLVTTLLHEHLGAGVHSVAWDLTERSHGSVSSGVYVVRISGPASLATRKVLLLK